MFYSSVSSPLKWILTRQKFTLCKKEVYWGGSVVRPNHVLLLGLNIKYDIPFEAGPIVQSSTRTTQ